MSLIIVDILASILQSITFAYVTIRCVDEDQIINKKKLFSMMLILLIIGQFFTGTFGDNWVVSVFVTHILALGIITAFHKKIL